MGNVSSADLDRVDQKKSKKLKGTIIQRRQQRQQQQQQQLQQQRLSEGGGSSSTTSDQVDQDLFTSELSFDSPHGSVSHPASSSTRSSPITSRSPWTLRAANASSPADNTIDGNIDDNSNDALCRKTSKQRQQHQKQRSSPWSSSSQAEFYARSSSENISSPTSATSSSTKPIDARHQKQPPGSPWTSSPTTILIATNNDFTSSVTEDHYSGFSSSVGSPLVDSYPTITSAPIPVLSIHEPHVQRFSLDTNQLQRLQLQDDDVSSTPGTSPLGAHYLDKNNQFPHPNNPYNNDNASPQQNHSPQEQQRPQRKSQTKYLGSSPEAKEWLKQKPTRSSAHLIHQYNFNRQVYYTPPGSLLPPSPSNTGSAASSRKNS
ncbi:hypothetical protein BGZ83_003243, partial [Gryganskiella cystojenkinii]